MTRQTLFVIETFAIDDVIARRLAVDNRPTDGAYALRRDPSRFLSFETLTDKTDLQRREQGMKRKPM